MEVRFPWQKMLKLIEESDTAKKHDAGETLGIKLQRYRNRTKGATLGKLGLSISKERRRGAFHRGGCSKRDERRWGGPLSKRKAASPGESAVWFSRKKPAANDRRWRARRYTRKIRRFARHSAKEN